LGVLVPSLLLAAHLTACSEVVAPTPAPADEEQLVAVAPGKEDNYYSNVAQEFELSGTLPVVMTDEQFADEVVRNDLVSRRLTAVGLYLTAYLTDKFEGVDSNDDGVISESEILFRNLGYGGFQAMVRNYTTEVVNLEGSMDAGYRVHFTLDVAGPRDLLARIPGDDLVDGSGGRAFDLRMPEAAAVDPTAVPRGDFRSFNPDTYTGPLETVRLEGRPLENAANAYPHFNEFFADGRFDVTLFFGHDYNVSRSDLQEAQEAFHRLGALGFTAPVDSFSALTADSGAFVRRATANGRELEIEVRIYHSDMFTTDRPRQHDLALSEMTARDVFVYAGHAGPYFGLYLDEARLATVGYREFATAPFPDRQQLVVAQGCQTYSQYADMLYANEAKTEANLDVITTVNYSYGVGTMDLVERLMTLDSQGRHRPVDFYTMVRGLNEAWINAWKEVFYGVMGIEGNPQLHPYANPSALGRACAVASDCGDSGGNACVAMTDGGPTQCAMVSLSAAACPTGTEFRSLALGNTIQTGACLLSAPE
jgi:hypothetical protein